MFISKLCTTATDGTCMQYSVSHQLTSSSPVIIVIVSQLTQSRIEMLLVILWTRDSSEARSSKYWLSNWNSRGHCSQCCNLIFASFIWIFYVRAPPISHRTCWSCLFYDKITVMIHGVCETAIAVHAGYHSTSKLKDILRTSSSGQNSWSRGILPVLQI